MAFLGGLLAIGGSILGGVLGNNSANKQADAIADSNKDAIALQREQFEWFKDQSQPAIDRGNAASDLFGANFGLTPTNFKASGQVPYQGNALSAGAPYRGSSSRYGNNILAQLRFGDRGNDSFSPFLGGRDYTGTPAAPQSTEPRTDQATGLVEGGPTDYQDQAYDRFKTSGHYRSAAQVTEDDINNLRGQMGAGGKLFSGAMVDGANQRLKRNEFAAFTNYNNDLAGLAGMGRNATAQVGAAGQNFANSAGNALRDTGYARASSYGQQHQNNMNVLGNIAQGIGGFF